MNHRQITLNQCTNSKVSIHGSSTAPCVALANRPMHCSRKLLHGVLPPASIGANLAHQSGAVLVISLIMLLLLTLIGTTGVQSSSLEEKMAGNMRQRNLAFQAAEAALRDAEKFIQGNDSAFNPLKLSGGSFQGNTCSSGLCPTPTTTSVSFNWAGNGRVYSGTISGVSRQPYYIIELIRTDPSNDSSRIYATFRITAFAWGGDDKSVVQLQSIYKLHANSFAY